MDRRIKRHILETVGKYAAILAASFLMALAMQTFILPFKFAPGGVNGLASLLQAVTGFPAGYTMFIINVPLLAVSFFFIKKSFTLDTLVFIFLSSLFTEVLRATGFYQYSDNALLAAIAGGVTEGAAIGVLLSVGASSGGTDIIGLLIQKRFGDVSIARILFALNAVVVIIAGIAYVGALKIGLTETLSVLIYSEIMLYVSSKSMEALMGFSTSVKFEVVTSKPEALARALMRRLHRGATIVESRGAFSGNPNNIVICVVRKRQTAAFRRIVKGVDPEAFAYSSMTREVLGKGFGQNA